MVMTNKILKVLLRLVNAKYPIITDLEYVPYDNINEHKFSFHFDIEALMKQFPDEELDYEYIYLMKKKGFGMPTEVFKNFFYNEDMRNDEFIFIIVNLIESIVGNEPYTIDFTY